MTSFSKISNVISHAIEPLAPLPSVYGNAPSYVSMVEDVKNEGGSWVTVQKSKAVLASYIP